MTLPANTMTSAVLLEELGETVGAAGSCADDPLPNHKPQPEQQPSASPYRVLSLFAGIGGFDLGLERTGGFKTVALCEIDPFCRRVLAKHWPGVPIYEDVRSLTAERLAADGIAVDVICGGFPCQGVSEAGLRTGLQDPRSGLWREYARLIGEIRPRYVIVENVSELLRDGYGMGEVLGDLAKIRYDAEWHSIPALAIGADHIRERIWIVAYPDSTGVEEPGQRGREQRAAQVGQAWTCHQCCACFSRTPRGWFARPGQRRGWDTQSGGPNARPRKRRSPANPRADRPRHPRCGGSRVTLNPTISLSGGSEQQTLAKPPGSQKPFFQRQNYMTRDNEPPDAGRWKGEGASRDLRSDATTAKGTPFGPFAPLTSACS